MMAAPPGTPLVTVVEPEPVAPAGADHALTILGHKACSGDESAPKAGVTRACLWNLAMHVPHPRQKRPGPARDGDAVHELLARVARSVPSRILRLEEWQNGKPRQAGREVEAYISAICVQNSDGSWQVCGEEINLAAFRNTGPSHFPALVRAMLVPQLPLALLWLDEMPRKGRLLGQLLRMSDRILVDSQYGGDEESLCLIRDLIDVAPVIFCDLGWMRLHAVRELVASFFDAPGMADKLKAIDRLVIRTSRNGRTTGLLLLGWLLSRCDLHRFSAVDLGRSDPNHYRWNVERGNRWFGVDFHTDADRDGGLDGLISLEIEAGGDRFFIEDVDADHMRMEAPHLAKPRVALYTRSDAELIVAGLGSHARDPVFGAALRVAADLVDAEAWNR